MGIIIKFTLKNIREKKLRTFLIVLAITLSTALFFASSAISGTLEQLYLKRMQRYYGTADIIMYAGPNATTSFFTLDKALAHQDRLQYAVGMTETRGYYQYGKDKTQEIAIKGIDIKDLEVFSPVLWVKKGDLQPFTGRKIVINTVMAQKYRLDTGDSLDIEIREHKYRYRIVGIVQPTGIFQEDGRVATVVVPCDTISSLYDARGRVSVMYAKIQNPQDEQAMIRQMSKEYPRYIVRETLTDQQIKQYTNGMTVPFVMMTLVVLLMSIFIIYTAYKVITMERLPIIGTFRSIGATKKMTNFVLMAESILYGMIGGLFGCGLGIGILYIMTMIIGHNPWARVKVQTSIRFTLGQLAAAFLLAIVLSVISSAVPIIKASKVPIKDIVLNKIEKTVKKRPWKFILGVVLFAAGLLIPFFVPKQIAIPMDGACMVFIIMAIVLLVPYITNGFIKIFERVYIYIFGNEGILAAKNLRDNKSILNNIALLAMGISALLMINTVSDSVMKNIVDFYKDARYDIEVWTYQMDRRIEQMIRTVEGVDNTYGIYAAYRIEIPEKKERINIIHGVDKNKILDYYDLKIADNRQEQLQKLDEGRNILLTYMLKERLGVEKGDSITLQMNRGKKEYKVIGFFDSIRWNGSYALVAERYLKADMSQRYYDAVYVKASARPEEVEKNIKDKFKRRNSWISTLEQMKKNDMQSNQQMFMILQGFSILALVIGIFGILNNFLISFMERKKSLAVLRSIGISKKQIIKMMFIEAFTGGVIGGLAGTVGGVLLVAVVLHLMKAMNMFLPIFYSIPQLIFSILAGVVISVIASISPSLKSSKLNIIDSLKYE